MSYTIRASNVTTTPTIKATMRYGVGTTGYSFLVMKSTMRLITPPETSAAARIFHCRGVKPNHTHSAKSKSLTRCIEVLLCDEERWRESTTAGAK